VVLAAVYAVPDPVVGDQVMAALQLRADASPFDPVAFSEFLAEQQDLGTKWAPRFVRVAGSLPVTATNKVLKRTLRAERWHVTDPLWWRPEPGAAYRELNGDDVSALDAATAGRAL
jgi:fatty-acyl-CoA synthase